MTVVDVLNKSIDRGRHTVLVVDDNPTTRYTTERFVRAAGFQTREAATAAQALAYANDHISAVVLDVHLPDLDGFEVCRRLRADPATSTLPVIHLSAAFVQNADKVAGLDAGADAYLVHPVEPAVLVATLQALIRARLAEERLRRSEARSRAIYNQAPAGMALVDGRGCFVDVNPVMTTLLARPREALVGQQIGLFAPEEWRRFVVDNTTSDATEAAAWKGEFPLMRPDHSWTWLEWTMSSSIEPGLRIGVALDVSERFALERLRQEVLEKEREARAAAEHSSRTKDDFIAVLSHELRNPLSPMRNVVEIMKQLPLGDPKLVWAREVLERALGHITLLVDDLLEISRITRGKVVLRKETLALGQALRVAAESAAPSIDAAGHALTIDWPDAHARIHADPTRVTQMIQNLLNNASKYTPQGGHIWLSARAVDGWAVISVRDNGEGIAREDLETVFQMFSQVTTSAHNSQSGLGIGLALVRGLVEMHGGSIEAFSDGPGQGSEFVLRLPLAAAEEGAAPVDARLATPPAAATDAAIRPLRMLIVDDNQDAADSLAMLLETEGHHIRVAHAGIAGVEAARDFRPDVALLDIGLPDINGLEVARRIRAQAWGRDMLLIALTGWGQQQDKDDSAAVGFDHHLTKPIRPGELTAILSGL